MLAKGGSAPKENCSLEPKPSPLFRFSPWISQCLRLRRSRSGLTNGDSHTGGDHRAQRLTKLWIRISLPVPPLAPATVATLSGRFFNASFLLLNVQLGSFVVLHLLLGENGLRLEYEQKENEKQGDENWGHDREYETACHIVWLRDWNLGLTDRIQEALLVLSRRWEPVGAARHSSPRAAARQREPARI